MTRALYYEEPELDRVEARVLSVAATEKGQDLVLDRTIFYPEGGGQPWDSGEISGVGVEWVGHAGGEIVHRLSGGGFRPGDTVFLALDRRRRNDHTIQHSAQHLLSAVLETSLGIHTVSFHLGERLCTIDATAETIPGDRLDAVAAAVEARIEADTRVLTHLCSPEEAARLPLRKRPPQGETDLRIVEIEGLDWSPCAGTHVASLSELRAFTILQAERYKGMTRLHFAAGARAVAELARAARAARGVAGILGCGVAEAEARAATLADRAEKAESRVRSLEIARAALEVALRLQGDRSGPATDGASFRNSGCLRFEFSDRGAESAQDTAKAGVAAGMACVALSVPDKTLCVMVPSVSSDWGPGGLGAALKPRLAELGGSGGGGKANFRAVFPDAEAARGMAEIVCSFLDRSPGSNGERAQG